MAEDNLRTIKEIDNIEKFIDFSSNDYLCLRKNNKVLQNGFEYAEKYGSTSSVSNTLNKTDLYVELQEIIKKYLKKSDVLIFPSGYQANITIIPAILNLFDEINVFSDKLNHNSIINGIINSKKHFVRYKNTDLNHLEFLLQKSNKKHKIVFTESVFSMDGTMIDIDQLMFLKKKYGFYLYVDEAHSIGMCGENGFDFLRGYQNDIEFIMGTMSKTLASQGAFLACDADIANYMINFCSGFIFSTGLNPFSIGAAIGAVKMISKINDFRQKIHENSKFFRSILRERNIHAIESNSNIISVIFDSNISLLEAEKTLLQEKIIAPAIRYPTVPKNLPRLRICLNKSHGIDDINKLTNILHEIRKKT